MEYFEGCTIRIEVDEDEALDFIKDALDPGAVLLPRAAVDKLWACYGVPRSTLEACGAIFADGQVMQ